PSTLWEKFPSKFIHPANVKGRLLSLLAMTKVFISRLFGHVTHTIISVGPLSSRRQTHHQQTVSSSIIIKYTSSPFPHHRWVRDVNQNNMQRRPPWGGDEGSRPFVVQI
ncbi:hypothetical protein BgiBS90_024077, partial [Biomphalaria glabrata]